MCIRITCATLHIVQYYHTSVLLLTEYPYLASSHEQEVRSTH